MNERSLTPDEEFANALQSHAPRFSVSLTADAAARLRDYYQLVTQWNPRLHLVAPCSAEEFAVRHVLESLFALPYLTPGARMLDVGSGAGLPVIPCLVARPDLSATLFESSAKKGVFLREALRRVGAEGQAQVVNERFEKTVAPEAEFVTCRALDRFSEMLPQLIRWAPRRSALLLYGGAGLAESLEVLKLAFTEVHIPASDRRSLFVTGRPSL